MSRYFKKREFEFRYQRYDVFRKYFLATCSVDSLYPVLDLHLPKISVTISRYLTTETTMNQFSLKREHCQFLRSFHKQRTFCPRTTDTVATPANPRPRADMLIFSHKYLLNKILICDSSTSIRPSYIPQNLLLMEPFRFRQFGSRSFQK